MESNKKLDNCIKSNYQYICDNYMLPEWFIYNDIDWLRYYPMKDKKIIEKDTEKIYIHKIFVKYLAYLNNMNLDNDITDKEIQKLLNIKVCDYDWTFLWHNPIYDKNSKELLLRKK